VNVDRVVNFHLPKQMENYLHRAGRTARAGRPGLVINLVTERDSNLIAKLDGKKPASFREAKEMQFGVSRGRPLNANGERPTAKRGTPKVKKSNAGPTIRAKSQSAETPTTKKALSRQKPGFKPKPKPPGLVEHLKSIAAKKKK
jgi:superfamily II DNA/RNA helicase